MVIPVVLLLQSCRQERREFKDIFSCIDFEASPGYMQLYLKETNKKGMFKEMGDGEVVQWIKCLPCKQGTEFGSPVSLGCLFVCLAV